MNYINFEVGNEVYKLRLNTRNIITLEKTLGRNPLSIFGNGDTVPTVTEMVAILHASLQQYNHGITMNDAYDIFDKYMDEGNSTIDFIPVILEIYKASGIIPKSVEDELKNA
jgi:hypothetical protein